ncbi:MAG: PAS domain-containing protein, partial [Ruminiclostridium sp.]
MSKRHGLFFEATHYRKDGSSFPVEVSVQSIIIGRKEVLLSIIRDITKRKKVEIALRASEEKYRSLFNTANDAIYLLELIEADTGVFSRFIEVNDSACKKLNHSREELLQMAPWDINSERTKDKIVSRYEEILKNGYATFETSHMTKDGIEIPVEVSS